MTPKITWTKTSIGYIAHVWNVLYKDRFSVLKLPEMQEGDRLGEIDELAHLWFEEKETLKDFPQDYIAIWCSSGASMWSRFGGGSGFDANGGDVGNWGGHTRGVFVIRPDEVKK